MPTLAEVKSAALRSLIPPPRLQLSTWMETHLVLPEGVSALPGKVRLYPYQREIADAIGDPTLERVTLVKPVRVGFTTLLTGAEASFVANDPCPVLCLLPTEADARDYVVSDLEPIFAATPAVAGLLSDEVEESERNTLLHRRFPGGSLKVVAAKAPRNLRRHTARVLMIDEADAMEITAEGSPITLAERRTLSFPDRKIVLGSTPLHEDTSHVLRAYAQSDQRVYEVPCPRCGAFTEILWAMIEWEPGKPDTAAYRCPGCQALIPETGKPGMVEAGRWRATHPEVVGHAGFRLNALISTLANASWKKLAAEFVKAKDDSDELQVFVNTILAQGWREAAVEVDEAALAKRAEPFDLEHIPPEVVVLTVGADWQDDRIELSYLGWTEAHPQEPLILGHAIVWGSPDDAVTLVELDQLLQATFPHPLGGRLGVDAAIMDAADRPDRVYPFCFARTHRKVWAGKGIAGARQVCEISKSPMRGGGRLFLVGVDTIKAALMERFARGRGVRFSHTLEPSYYEQLASHRKVIRYVRGVAVRRFELKAGYQDHALDTVVYAWAARHMLQVPWAARRVELATPARTESVGPRAAGPVRRIVRPGGSSPRRW